VGFQDEFVSLFAKNHLPVLREQIEDRPSSRSSPMPHGDGRADWIRRRDHSRTLPP
jgi:hypothetical protein